MFIIQQHVTLCLLITYHWHGSAASPNVSVRAATVRIAGEVNGSPTDAPLNIPVVKRSSNQAGSANELRPVLLVERARAVVDSAPTTLFERPHEYSNRNEEKYSNGSRGPMRKLGGVEAPFVDTKIFEHDRAKRDENAAQLEDDERAAKEKGNPGLGIKSSIQAEDAVAMLVELGLIGKANSSPLATKLQRRFDYEGASASTIRHKRNEEDDARGVAEMKKEYKKPSSADELNNRETIVSSSSLAPDASDFDARRIPDQDPEEVYAKAEGEDSSSLKGLARIDAEIAKAEAKQIKQKQKKDHDASGLSNRLSSSLKLTERASAERSKSSSGAASSSVATSGEINKLLDSKRLHQQSRNTKPQTIAQHLRRNIKRQILSFDDLMYGRNARSNGNANEDSTPRKFTPTDDRNRRQLGGPQLRFIPSNNHRSHPLENRIHFGRYAQQTFANQESDENNNNNNDVSAFYPNDETNPRAIEKFPRFDAAQIESLKGVFDKYEDAREGKRNEFPNVRMILPKQIFVAPPRLVYHTKILPAPFAFPPYFQAPNNNLPKNHNSVNTENMINSISGVFDPKSLNELVNREVIPVSENSEPSLRDTLNFVTPLPRYRDDGGDGQVSIRVNQASEDLAKSEEIYRVSGEGEEAGIGDEDQEREASQRDGEDEDSPLNHESPIDVATAHHPGAGGSSYDNSVSTFGSAEESGSGNVDQSAVIEGNTDEYVNHESPIRESYSPAVRTRAQSAAKSNDETYDRDGYKWSDPKYDNDNERYAANYSFGYRVSDYETQNNFGHQETRKEGLTTGKYHVKLPDGRIQEVDYHVDDTGYHARVSYRQDLESLSAI